MSPRILFVDDERDITESMRVALRSEPFTVLTANCAEAGLDLLRSQPIDVIVSDERMPGLNGAAFLATVRTEFPTVGRIILTGEATVEATISAVNDARVFRVLTKPCPIPELVSCLHAAVAAGRATTDELAGLDIEAASQQLDAALDSMRMVYQPIFSLRDGRIYAYEALLRSTHESLRSPREVIDMACVLNRAADLDCQVCRRVAIDAATLPPDTFVFVNLLPQSLGVSRLWEGLDHLAPYAARVALEITERAQLDPDLDLVAEVGALRSRGFRVALDDLGAGYAGLTSFAALGPDIVKFDLELVSGVHRSETSSKLVASMIEVCQDLGVLTVGEGVEATEELRHLEGLGCDLVQGFGLAAPQPPWFDVTIDQLGSTAASMGN